MPRSLFVIAIALCVILALQYVEMPDSAPPTAGTAAEATHRDSTDADQTLRRAFVERRSNVQVGAGGTVARVLPDDENGDRHQRFVLELESGQTLLIAHNIDLAPRIDSLRPGDYVSFYGEYEWNEQGGVIHWTHADPTGRHVAGWLEHEGTRYQ
ncbi:MAG: DUF3465 domain-containing protein [Gammaproteobacteria bacterium]|jgi:hypothetical protein